MYIIIDYFKQDCVDIVNWLTAIGTLGMCIVSWSNTKFTKTQTIYTNKIIATKNVLYSILALQRNIFIDDIKLRIEILEVFICLFLLKREKINENEFRCEFCFNDDNKTSEETNKKIENVLQNIFPLSTFEKRYEHYKKLCDIIGLYFGKNICNNKISADEKQMYEIDYIIEYQILKGYLFYGDEAIMELKNKFNQGDWTLFHTFVYEYNNAVDSAIFNGYNDIFDNFYNTSYNDEDIKNDIKNQIEQYIKCLIPDYSIIDISSKYNKIVNFMSENINDGFVGKISSDFDKQKIYFLSEISWMRRKIYQLKKQYYLKKRKKQFNNTFHISFSQSLSFDKVGCFITLKINREQKSNNAC